MTRAFQQHTDPDDSRGRTQKTPRIPDPRKKPDRNSGPRQSTAVSARRMLSSSPDGNPEPGPSPGYLAARRPASRKPA
jgi:hypothetical protein